MRTDGSMNSQTTPVGKSEEELMIGPKPRPTADKAVFCIKFRLFMVIVKSVYYVAMLQKIILL